MTANHKISVQAAIDIIKSGGTVGANTLSDVETTQVKAMDALLLAENGFVVPDGNIIYNDSDIQYDPDFDEVEWGVPVPFRQLKKELSEIEEVVVKVRVKNEGMKEWVSSNRKKLDEVVSKLLEDLYQTERLLKD